ncbi:hypothetical protein RT41_GL001701 [Lactococcus fujiensis JCM 16395]|uniref:Uncharacterized protein n=1 Tax=Lactococcus fujiensis JCM 16395 TaxID=1291764 RepID=A0A2A5RK40_9LACT|nr:hypothetical protein RT41_GL001701 [Lactococcus fujiensis JCM 16395]
MMRSFGFNTGGIKILILVGIIIYLLLQIHKLKLRKVIKNTTQESNI